VVAPDALGALGHSATQPGPTIKGKELRSTDQHYVSGRLAAFGQQYPGLQH
jgi:hypothetical protein